MTSIPNGVPFSQMSYRRFREHLQEDAMVKRAKRALLEQFFFDRQVSDLFIIGGSQQSDSVFIKSEFLIIIYRLIERLSCCTHFSQLLLVEINEVKNGSS